MTVLVLQADARNLPLPDGCVDLVVTSPPYFGLRSYTDGGEHYAGQLGSEATPAAYIEALVACTREWMRVLKPPGSIFVNLGDKYATRYASLRGGGRAGLNGDDDSRGRSGQNRTGAGEKSLLGLPWRYALACLDQLGLILRAEIIWAKPNGLPESVQDRVRRAHEQVFHFTRQPRYYSAVDEIREPHTGNAHPSGNGSSRRWLPSNGGVSHRALDTDPAEYNPLGKLPGSVWSIPSQPLTVPPALGVDHFAAFPMELPRRIIAGWSPRSVCRECGFLLGSSYDIGMLGVRRTHNGRAHQRRFRTTTRTEDKPVLLQEVLDPPHVPEQGIDDLPATDDSRLRGDLEARPSDGAEERLPDGTPVHHGRAPRPSARAGRSCASPEQHQDGQPDREPGTARQDRTRPAAEATAKTVPVPSLRRPHPHHRNAEYTCPHCGSDQLRPSVVVDVFGGTGTTALLARTLGRNAITADLSADYCRIATWRTQDRGEIARAMQVDKPPPVSDLQEPLWA